MAVKFEEELSDDWEIMMDMIFESVGLKYSTVSSMIRRNKPKETETSVPQNLCQRQVMVQRMMLLKRMQLA